MQDVSRKAPAQVWSKMSPSVHGGLSAGALLQLRSVGWRKGYLRQAETKVASARWDLKPLQIP